MKELGTSRQNASSPDTFLRVKKPLILRDTSYNKGVGFTEDERDRLNLRGLLPPAYNSLELQVKRAYNHLQLFKGENSGIQKYLYLGNLKRHNETLFYKLALDHIDEIMPLVYTPTVGKGCQLFGEYFQQGEGMYFGKKDRGQIRKMMDNWPQENVDIIVVTDGSRILGLGDLGVNGMGIPIGKLSLYVAGAGFHPARTLPVTIDAGTNTQAYLDDPFYLGSREKRIPDEEFYPLIDEFMVAAYDKWPNVLVQFEDFSNNHCFKLLDIYRNKYLCFNDDIQGTGAVIAAGFLNAVKMSGIPIEKHRLVFFGAGSAGIGVADTIVSAIVEDCKKVTEEQARRQFWFIDTRGMITKNRGDKLAAHKLPYARDDNGDTQAKTILDVIRFVKPTGIIGLAGFTGGVFTEEIIKEMAKLNDRPIIFPLSNPTSKAECSAEDAYKFTNGKCIFASGSPFDPVEVDGVTHYPSQGNNMYVFPGLGFGAVLAQAKKVTTGMIIIAARALANSVNEEEFKEGRLYPVLDRIRDLSAEIAVAVIEKAFEEGVATIERPEDLLAYVKSNMFYPAYIPLSENAKL